MDPLPPILPVQPQIAAAVRAAPINPDARGAGRGPGERGARRRPRPMVSSAGEPADPIAAGPGTFDDGGDDRPHVDVTV